jgi:hypothetical protein
MASMLNPTALAAPLLSFDNFDDVVEPIELVAFVGALLVGGVVLMVTAAAGLGASRAARTANAIVGAICVGYAAVVYLADRSAWVHFSTLIVPIVLIINLVRSRRASGDPMPVATRRQQ